MLLPSGTSPPPEGSGKVLRVTSDNKNKITKIRHSF
jgi:hypothetical protein